MTTTFVDSSFAANKVNRRSHCGHILFVNRAPVKWYSKRQQTVETSAFLAEYLAMKLCIEDVEFLRFKLKMFGIPLSKDKPSTYILCDNESVVKIASNVESSLNKKHSAVAYNFTRSNVAAGVCKIAWIPNGGEYCRRDDQATPGGHKRIFVWELDVLIRRQELYK